MREIKFRALDKINNKWLESYYNHNKFIPIGVYNDVLIEVENDDVSEVGFVYKTWSEDDCILMQYTGIKDKNGVDIYEGDIVKIDEDIAVIIFEDGSFKAHINNSEIKTASYYWKSISERYAFEVIGNICENPELLEESK